MFKIILLILTAVIGFSDFASANIRAPYVTEYKGATEIRASIPDLTVMKEELLFECDTPYRGDLEEVERQVREVRTSATYIISAKKETDAHFDFILTVNQPAKASINNIASVVSSPIMVRKGRRNSRFGGFFDDRYQVTFSGRLKPGRNIINIRYSQPMSVLERMGGIYPFYISSDFASFFSYDLSPLREWHMDDAFTMNIRISFKDDTGWTKYLFGSDYIFHLYGVSGKEYESIAQEGRMFGNVWKEWAEIPFKINKNSFNDSLETTVCFEKGFPDMFEVVCEY